MDTFITSLLEGREADSPEGTPRKPPLSAGGCASPLKMELGFT